MIVLLLSPSVGLILQLPPDFCPFTFGLLSRLLVLLGLSLSLLQFVLDQGDLLLLLAET